MTKQQLPRIRNLTTTTKPSKTSTKTHKKMIKIKHKQYLAESKNSNSSINTSKSRINSNNCRWEATAGPQFQHSFYVYPISLLFPSLQMQFQPEKTLKITDKNNRNPPPTFYKLLICPFFLGNWREKWVTMGPKDAAGAGLKKISFDSIFHDRSAAPICYTATQKTNKNIFGRKRRYSA